MQIRNVGEASSGFHSIMRLLTWLAPSNCLMFMEKTTTQTSACFSNIPQNLQFYCCTVKTRVQTLIIKIKSKVGTLLSKIYLKLCLKVQCNCEEWRRMSSKTYLELNCKFLKWQPVKAQSDFHKDRFGLKRKTFDNLHISNSSIGLTTKS